jgi:hypothetical protein
MSIVADTHLHVYGCHDAAALLTAASGNLAAIAGAPGATKVLFLTERRDCRFFADLAGSRGIPGGTWRAIPSPDPEVLTLADAAGESLLLAAGRQIVTRERLEILALTSDSGLPDGLPIIDVIDAVLSSGGVPVLAWAPGKWWFSRGRVVDAMLERFGPSQLLLGDSSLRPVGWPQPRSMREAVAAGRPVLAGSDPLPFPGEEQKAGRYGVLLDGELDQSHPVASLRTLLTGNGVRRIGRRDGPLELLRRLRELRRAASER